MEWLYWFYMLLVLGTAMLSLFAILRFTLLGKLRDHVAKERIENAQLVRSLTPDELKLLEPLLVDPNRMDRLLTIKGSEVYRIEGEYGFHALLDSGGINKLSSRIDRVEVLLLFDAGLHVQPHNVAEVILADRYAVVLRLNDRFDVFEAQEYAQQVERQKEAWTKGSPGVLEAPMYESYIDNLAQIKSATKGEMIQPLASVLAEDQLVASPVISKGQRMETAAEARDRTGQSLPWRAGVSCITAFVCIYFAVLDATAYGLFWLALAVLFAYRTKQRILRLGSPTPIPVNLVQGVLREVRTADRLPEGKSQLMLGDKIILSVPKYWRPALDLSSSEPIDVELRADDFRVVKVGRELSLEAELQTFPPIEWARYLILMFIGVGALYWAAILTPSVPDDAIRIFQGIAGQVHEAVTDLQALPEPEMPEEFAIYPEDVSSRPEGVRKPAENSAWSALMRLIWYFSALSLIGWSAVRAGMERYAFEQRVHTLFQHYRGSSSATP